MKAAVLPKINQILVNTIHQTNLDKGSLPVPVAEQAQMSFPARATGMHAA